MTKLVSVDERDYRSVLGQFCTGVTVVTSLDAGEPVGFTCQSFTALSLDPPLVLFCPRKESRTWPRMRRRGRFAVNVLAAGQQALAAGFARSGGDKFAGVEWSESAAGLPLVDGALGWLDCAVTDEIDAGDHTVVIGSVEELGEGPAHDPLLFFRGDFLDHQGKERCSHEACDHLRQSHPARQDGSGPRAGGS